MPYRVRFAVRIFFRFIINKGKREKMNKAFCLDVS
nr:MAG TPA: hypothetical protein [Caudoviricetes sp.]